jgi:hypothetical protein
MAGLPVAGGIKGGHLSPSEEYAPDGLGKEGKTGVSLNTGHIRFGSKKLGCELTD